MKVKRLSLKNYIGHVAYLKDKCDYVLVPRICNYGKGNRVCMKFNGIYDVVHNKNGDTMKKGFTTFLSALKANTPPVKKDTLRLDFYLSF